MNAVILAGGQGTRLWPMSRQDKPKQFFSILSSFPMIVEVCNRLSAQFSQDQLYIATLEPFVPITKELLPQIKEDHFFTEPSKRYSGPAMALSACRLKQAGKGDEPFVFIPTDHYIADIDRFLHTLAIGEQLIKKTGKMVDISVTPEFASTTLGYTKIADQFSVIDGVEVYTFAGHTEKPDHAKAKEYLESGKYLWHANYYMWTPTLLLQAYKKHAPEMYALLEQIDKADSKEQADELYAKMPSLSIDYAVTEKIDPEDVLIIKGDFGWSDIGAWDVLHDRLKQKQADEYQNVLKGDVLTLETSNSLVYSQQNKMIATIGLSDMVIVDTPDALLVCPKGRAQEVKKIIDQIKSNKLDKYL